MPLRRSRVQARPLLAPELGTVGLSRARASNQYPIELSLRHTSGAKLAAQVFSAHGSANGVVAVLEELPFRPKHYRCVIHVPEGELRWLVVGQSGVLAEGSLVMSAVAAVPAPRIGVPTGASVLGIDESTGLRLVRFRFSDVLDFEVRQVVVETVRPTTRALRLSEVTKGIHTRVVPLPAGVCRFRFRILTLKKVKRDARVVMTTLGWDFEGSFDWGLASNWAEIIVPEGEHIGGQASENIGEHVSASVGNYVDENVDNNVGEDFDNNVREKASKNLCGRVCSNAAQNFDGGIGMDMRKGTGRDVNDVSESIAEDIDKVDDGIGEDVGDTDDGSADDIDKDIDDDNDDGIVNDFNKHDEEDNDGDAYEARITSSGVEVSTDRADQEEADIVMDSLGEMVNDYPDRQTSELCKDRLYLAGPSALDHTPDMLMNSEQAKPSPYVLGGPSGGDSPVSIALSDASSRSLRGLRRALASLRSRSSRAPSSGGVTPQSEGVPDSPGASSNGFGSLPRVSSCLSLRSGRRTPRSPRQTRHSFFRRSTNASMNGSAGSPRASNEGLRPATGSHGASAGHVPDGRGPGLKGESATGLSPPPRRRRGLGLLAAAGQVVALALLASAADHLMSRNDDDDWSPQSSLDGL